MLTPPKKPRILLKFYDAKRTLLYVSVNTNMQSIATKEWFKFVNHIVVKHFDSLDDLEDERFTIVHRDNPLFNERKPNIEKYTPASDFAQ